MPKSKSYPPIHLAVLLVLIYLVIFLKIDTYPIRWWDESMFAVNTYEMLHNHKYFSLYYNNAPDLFNTKPPLAVWTQLFFVKLFGYNEMAVRLPSTIAAALSVIVLFLFTDKKLGKIYAWLSALILLTSQGFIGFHTARTADSDALLTLFVLCANIYFLQFVYEKRPVSVLWFFFFITLAFFTKMYAALLFMPAYLIILLWHKQLKDFLLNRYFFFGIVLFAVAGFSILYVRELDTPGYIHEILFKDAGRLMRVVEDHHATWEFYLDNFIFSRYAIWFLFFLIGCMFAISDWLGKRDGLFTDLVIMIGAYLLIISLSATKLEWYDMPLYPLLAVISAHALFQIFDAKIVSLKDFNRTVIFVLVIVFAYPYWIMFRKAQANIIPPGEKKNEANERFLFSRSNSPSDLNGTKVYFDGWNGSLLFYKYKFAEKGENLLLIREADFSKNDKVLLSSDSLFNVVKMKYHFTLLADEGATKLLKID